MCNSFTYLIILYIRGTGTNLEEDKFIGTKPTESLKKYACQNLHGPQN